MAKKLGAGMALRPKVDETKARAIEERAEARGIGANVQAIEQSDVQSPNRRGIVERKGRITTDGRRGAGERRRLTVYLPPELARRLEILAAVSGSQFSELASEAIEAYLVKRGA